MNDNIKKYILKLPCTPGVYIFKDKSDHILYIGKATNLKSRVSSYFNGRLDKRPVQYAVGKIYKIDTIETDSVLEALILESNLIKKYQPKYNVDLKDDKSFSYAVITKDIFPRIEIRRESELEETKSSKHKSQSCSSNLKSDLYSSIFGPYISKKQLEIALKIIRKIFPYHSNKQETEKGCLDYQIGLCPGPYEGDISRDDYLKNIRSIKMILGGRKKNLVKKLETEMKKYADSHEFEKAAETRNKIFALNHIRDIALLTSDWNGRSTSKKEIKLSLRIEAYDISNISGQYAVGSMVVFKNDEPDKSQYRKFRIKTIQGADDVGMMKEVLIRRFNNNWPKPNLILLDGGQGHLNMYEKLMRGLKLNIPAIAVAKGSSRKNLELRIWNLESESIIKNIIDNKILIKQIMDEAHRFAIGYHKKLRKREFLQ